MHIFFSGIGGSGIGPLSLIALKAGHKVSGSDKAQSSHIEKLKSVGIDVHVGQSRESIESLHRKSPIDWLVYASAIAIEHPDHPELEFARLNNIRMSKRDELLNYLIKEGGQRLLSIAGTHGKSTTTAMIIWLFKNLEIPVSYSLGAEISFGPMGDFVPGSKYFVYECDEYDHNFLKFEPYQSTISGIDWDHADIYPTRNDYYSAFREFIKQSKFTLIWKKDADKIRLEPMKNVREFEEKDLRQISLPGLVNRQDAYMAVQSMQSLGLGDEQQLIEVINAFPGVHRRFEEISANIYSDYAHTPPKIRGALEEARELTAENIVVVYEGLHNTRQHFIKDQLKSLFSPAKQIYVVPSYLAREDITKALLSPDDIAKIVSKKGNAFAAQLDAELKAKISDHALNGNLVLCFSAGGAGSLDEWLRKNFS